MDVLERSIGLSVGFGIRSWTQGLVLDLAET